MLNILVAQSQLVDDSVHHKKSGWRKCVRLCCRMFKFVGTLGVKSERLWLKLLCSGINYSVWPFDPSAERAFSIRLESSYAYVFVYCMMNLSHSLVPGSRQHAARCTLSGVKYSGARSALVQSSSRWRVFSFGFNYHSGSGALLLRLRARLVGPLTWETTDNPLD